MININHLLKVAAAWISIVYVLCYAIVGMFPNIRPGFVMYGLHMGAYMGSSVLNWGTFIFGLIIWNVMVAFGILLFGVLYNNIKK